MMEYVAQKILMLGQHKCWGICALRNSHMFIHLSPMHLCMLSTSRAADIQREIFVTLEQKVKSLSSCAAAEGFEDYTYYTQRGEGVFIWWLKNVL